MALRTLDALQLAVAMDLLAAGHISARIEADHQRWKVAEACGYITINPAEPAPLESLASIS